MDSTQNSKKVRRKSGAPVWMILTIIFLIGVLFVLHIYSNLVHPEIFSEKFKTPDKARENYEDYYENAELHTVPLRNGYLDIAYDGQDIMFAHILRTKSRYWVPSLHVYSIQQYIAEFDNDPNYHFDSNTLSHKDEIGFYTVVSKEFNESHENYPAFEITYKNVPYHICYDIYEEYQVTEENKEAV